jgi:V/A-type H+-transporting ATPase subunit D
MSGREIVPTHSAYLELKAERAGMEEGYRFLDEKRLILASEILATLRDYEDTLSRLRAAEGEALSALRAALGRHGLEDVSVYPPAAPADCVVACSERSVLGVRIEDPPAAEAPAKHAALEPIAAPVNPSPEAEACRDRFARLLPHAARLAVLTGNLERLRREYLRTARRARALEDVLLPEIDDTLRAVDSALEESEREEAVRGRYLGV